MEEKTFQEMYEEALKSQGRDPYTFTYVPPTYPPTGVCPSCGRCRECGHAGPPYRIHWTIQPHSRSQF